ncbi:ABC-2 type transport system permease protein [Novosphingobium sp. PhB165]|uniref:ABC transporter permease n=1 Tax=Novosphingobium sp. PhB165 TaxID=2485105 RepID=UPI0010509975|nr:ABC transporter permease [Novosphingobium sp. PhB165]TCM18657.1 ABC-2 type transport system permease protein [Novosphingobium sp. PhB165]
MSDKTRTGTRTGRLSVLAAAWVVARRDFTAILFSRSFFFFLLGPLFPVIVGALAGSVGARVQASAEQPGLGVAMSAADVDALSAARARLVPALGDAIPNLIVLEKLAPGQTFDARAALAGKKGIAAVLTGTLAEPVLTGPDGLIGNWRGPVSMLAVQARSGHVIAYPEIALQPVATSSAGERRGRLTTAQSAQMMLFLLTMMLAGMVLSNLVEEKGNKIIEVLAAAIPMDSVFFGKLFAMLGVSLVGIGTWAAAGSLVFLLGGSHLPHLAEPAVGWPMLIGLGVVYFAMAYLLLGSVFLSIGSMATTVREVQTLSMPVTMLQLMVFFFASFAMTQPGSMVETAALIFPFSSPFAMLARGAQDPAILPHVLAIGWQALWVVVLVRIGARLFRSRVMKSGPARAGKRTKARRAAEAV